MVLFKFSAVLAVLYAEIRKIAKLKNAGRKFGKTAFPTKNGMRNSIFRKLQLIKLTKK